MAYSKNDCVQVTIEDIGVSGEGIGKIDGYTLFVKDTVIGDVVNVKIMKAKKNYGYARLVDIVKPSKDRVEPVCAIARQCGGCQIQAMSYEAQLKYKQKLVSDNLKRIGGLTEGTDYEMCDILGMEEPFRYRNKAQYPVGEDKDGNIVMGFYAGHTHSIIPCPDILFSYFDEGQEVKLNDGKIVLELSAPLEEDIFCAKVKKGGELTSRKSIAIKDVTVPLPVLTETDKQNLKLLRKYHVTGVMLPFVRNADDLITLRKELCADGMDYIRIFAKIESLEGVENLPSLLPFCDEIVIARGDLGNAIPLPKLPAIQKRIAMTCLRAKKPFMVVTQMLASMEQNPVPTRAEVTDIFQAVLDGASSLMLTGETAVGAYPEEAIKILAQTSEEALRFKIAKF